MSDTQNDTQTIDNKVENETTTKPKKKRGWRFYLKIFAVFCLFMLISVGIAIFYVLNKLTSDSNFEKLVNQKVSEAINMDVSFQKIGMSFPSIELTNIHIATDSADMKLDSYIASVRVRPDFLSAISGNIMVDYLCIASSSTLLEMKAIKSNDVAKANAGGQSSFDLNSINFPFKSLEINDIRLNYIDGASKSNYNVKLNKAAISYSLVSSGLPYEIDAEWVDKASVNATGDLYWPSKVVSNINLKVTDINEVRKYVPDDYKNYLKDVTGSTVRASVEYNINTNAVEVKSYDVNVEPLLTVKGSADMPQMTPLKLNVDANVSALNVSEVWPMVKDYVPAEYGLNLSGGTIGADVKLAMDGDKPMELAVTAQPQKLEVSTSYVPEKIVIQKGNVTYDNTNKVKVTDFEVALADTNVKLQSLSIALDDMTLNTVFGINVGIENLLKNLKAYLPEAMNQIAIKGNVAAEGNVNGKLTDIATLRLNGSVTSKNIKLTEKTTSASGNIDDINIRLNGVGKECGSIDIESMTASAIGASLKVNGTVKNQKDIGFDCAAKGNISVGEFSKLANGLFGLPVKDGQYKGNLDVDLKVGGTVDNPKPSGKIVAKNVYADVSQYGMVVKDFNGTVTADTDKLIMNNIKAGLLGGELDFNGTVSDFKNMKVAAVANIKGTDLADVRKLIGAFVPDMSPELDFSGKADLNASLQGSTSAPAIKGSAQLVDVKFTHPAVLRPIEKINGRVNFNNDGLDSESLTAYWGTSKANVSGNLKDWAKFITNFKFTVSPLDITDAAGFFLKDSGFEVLGTGTGNGSVTGALEKIKVDCLANVPVGTVTAVITEGGESMKFPYQKLTARAIYCNNILDVATASLKLFDGDITAKAKVNLASEPILFDVDANINQLMTQEFLKVNADAKYHKTLEGGINGTAKFTGNTTGLNSINGNASLAMPKGSYDSPDVIKKIADKLKKPSLASGTIENLSGDYVISDGRISSNNTMGTSKDNKVVYRGSIGLDTTLDGSLDFELGKATCDSGYLKELIGNSETLKLSSKVKGSLTSPSIDLPLSDIAKKSVTNELNKILEKNNLGGAKDKVEKAAEKITDKLGDVGNKLGKSLKKLFK